MNDYEPDYDEPTCPASTHTPNVDGCIHCPECGDGVVVTGATEGDTGHVQYACTRCPFSG